MEERTVDVAVLGAGFAGLRAARQAAWRCDPGLCRLPVLRVLVVDRHPYQTLRPKLPEAVAGTSECAARLAVADALAGSAVDFLKATVLGIDPEAHRVATDAGPIRYGRLVVALGSVPAVPDGVPGAGENALPLWDFDDACALRRRVTMLAQAATRSAVAEERAALGSIAIVGGGFVGVELAGHLAARLSGLAAAFGLGEPPWRVHLIEQQTGLLTRFPPALGRAAAAELARSGVVLHTGCRVQAVRRDGVILADGTRIAAATVLWAGGIVAHPLVGMLGDPSLGGRIRVRADLRSENWPDLYAAGDAAALRGPDGRILDPSAQVAAAEGAVAGGNMRRDLNALPTRRYRPRDFGVAVGLSDGRALAHLPALGLVRHPARMIKEAALAHYLHAVGGLPLLRGYFDPLFRRPWRAGIDVGCPTRDEQRATPPARLSA